MSCKQKAHCLNFDLIREITSSQLYDSESGYKTPEKLRIFFASAIGKNQPFRYLATSNNDCLRRSPGNRCQMGNTRVQRLPNGNAQTKEKERRQGENVRAATARGFSYKRANMQGRECLQRPEDNCKEELPAGARGILRHASRFALAYQRLSMSCRRRRSRSRT